jgi:hypothetical protein
VPATVKPVNVIWPTTGCIWPLVPNLKSVPTFCQATVLPVALGLT